MGHNKYVKHSKKSMSFPPEIFHLIKSHQLAGKVDEDYVNNESDVNSPELILDYLNSLGYVINYVELHL